MLTKHEKESIVSDLALRFSRQRVLLFAAFRGISVGALARFRRELKALGAEFKVAKKTLLKRALGIAGIDLDPEELEGEIGVILGYEDEASPAKLAAKFAKGHEGFKLVRGILGGKLLEAAGVAALAKLPSREILLAQVARVFQAPIQGLAFALAGNIRNVVTVLNAVKASKK